MNCAACHDTGSLSKTIDGFLDCTKCPVATERTIIEAWAAGQRGTCSCYALAWKAHRRALDDASTAALRSLISNITTEYRCDPRMLGFYQGQLAVIESHLQPARQQVEIAREAITQFTRRVTGSAA